MVFQFASKIVVAFLTRKLIKVYFLFKKINNKINTNEDDDDVDLWLNEKTICLFSWYSSINSRLIRSRADENIPQDDLYKEEIIKKRKSKKKKKISRTQN